jgi:glycosyltransferase involved in cell wall biosynthesis
MSPVVSVLMSVFNGEKYIDHSIRSILNQTYSSLELIIVNDGSFDQSMNILMDVFKQDERIRIIRQENLGLTRSLNRAAKLARGKYIARQDADDISYPGRLSRQVEFLEEHPDYFLTGSAYHMKDDRQEGLVEPDVPFVTGYANIKKVIYRYNPFCHSSVMFRNDLSRIQYFYDSTLPYAQDYDLWLRIFRYYKAENLPDKLCLRSFGSQSIGRCKKRAQRGAVIRIKCRYIWRYGFHADFWYGLCKDIAVAWFGWERNCRKKKSG